MTLFTVLRRPSAFLPIVMSIGALAIIVVVLMTNGAAPQVDEGAAAHSWQLLMAAQVPIILFFAAKWGPRTPRQAGQVLALQIGAAITAAAPVFLLGW